MVANNVFRVSFDSLSEIASHFARAGKKCAKLNCPAPTYTVSNVRIENVAKEGLRERLVKVCDITVDMHTRIYSVKGWEFCAQLEHQGAAGNIVRSPGNCEIPATYRTSGPDCDHCNQARRRLNTYILRNEATGSYQQVGSTCLADFLDTDVALLVAELDHILTFGEQFADKFGDDFGDEVSAGGKEYFKLTTYLPIVAELIHTDGWFPKSGGQTPTASIAFEIMAERNNAYTRKLVVSDNSSKVAMDALSWARSLDGELNDYLHNLKVVASNEAVDMRGLGLAASIVSTFLRSEAKRKEREATAPSEWQGTVGERTHFVLTVGKVISFETQYGTTHIHIMRDDNSNAFVWKASGTYIDEGSEVILCGTVKAHETYERTGVKQTILTRCKQVDAIPAAKPARKPRKATAA